MMPLEEALFSGIANFWGGNKADLIYFTFCKCWVTKFLRNVQIFFRQCLIHFVECKVYVCYVNFCSCKRTVRIKPLEAGKLNLTRRQVLKALKAFRVSEFENMESVIMVEVRCYKFNADRSRICVRSNCEK